MNVPKIILFGAAHIDRLGHTFEAPTSGYSNPGTFRNAPGGGALNVASTLSALGNDVALYSIVGDDDDKKHLQDTVGARGFDFNFQISLCASTASYTSIVGPDGELAIALADMKIYDEFDAANALLELDGFETNDWVLVDANLPAPAIEVILKNAKQNNCKTTAMAVSFAKASRLTSFLNSIDYLFCNHNELSAICNMPEETEMNALLKQFKAHGGQSIVVSNGALNVHALDGKKPLKTAVEEISISGDVIGAGDALTAGTLSSLIAGSSLDKSIKQGIMAATAILQVEGPWHGEIANCQTNKIGN